MSDGTEKHVLSLSPDYVLSWGLWEAVRELLQNSIDESATNPQAKQVFQYDPASETLTIGTTNCHLEPRTLLLGVSGKRDQTNTIGQFGEGYKIALLVLARLSYDVVLYNGDKIWRPRFEFSEQYQESVLTIEISTNPNPCNGVSFKIRDVDADHFGEINERYLVDVRENLIYDEDYMKGRVFVNGLFVCDVEGLEYGYNFTPDRINLDRDRGMASTFEVAYEASRLWEQSGDDAQLYDNLKAGILDVQHVTYLEPVKNAYVVQTYLTEHDGAIPVSTQDELNRMRGHRVQLVPKALRDLLRRMHSFVFNREGTPSERLERFAHQFRRQLNKEGQRELDAILENSKDWDGPAEPGGSQPPGAQDARQDGDPGRGAGESDA